MFHLPRTSTNNDECIYTSRFIIGHVERMNVIYSDNDSDLQTDDELSTIEVNNLSCFLHRKTSFLTVTFFQDDEQQCIRRRSNAMVHPHV